MFATNPIFECDVPEKGQMVHRKVYSMPLTPENVKIFWEKAAPFKMLFWDHIGGDFQKFLEMLISKNGDEISANGLFWVIDDFVGLYYMTHIGSFDAQIHYTFFDRRHWGRHGLTRMMIKYVFDKYNLHRLSAEIPRFRHGTFDFIKQVGLRQEGVKRSAAWYNNQWYDVECWGILRDDTVKWDLPKLELD